MGLFLLILTFGVSSLALAQQDSIQTTEALNQQVVNLIGEGRFSEAIPVAQNVLSIRERALGPDHPDTATGLDNLAELYGSTGAYAKAEPLLQRALAIREKVFGPEHPDTATALVHLAWLYYSTGAYVKAEPLLQRALAIRKKVLGPEHPDTANSLNILAGLYEKKGPYTKAEALFEQALTIREKALGPEHPLTAEALSNLAASFKKTGAYAKAEPLLLRALAIREKMLGPDHPDTARGLNHLAELYQDTGAYAKAEPLLQRALAIREKVFGPEHPDTATSLSNMADFHRQIGSYTKADPLYKKALTIRENVLGPNHPATADSLNRLALLNDAMGSYTQAELLYQRALTIRENVLGPEHPHTAQVLNNLADLYKNTGAYRQAEPLYQRALAIHEKTLGPEHLFTSYILSNLADLYSTRAAYPQAELLYQRALTIREKVLGPEHPNTGQVLNSLALLYADTGVYTQSASLLQRALAIAEKAFGPEHPATAQALNNLSTIYTDTGAYALAEPLLQRALGIHEKTVGPKHPDTATALSSLASLYEATGFYAKAEPLLQRALTIQENAFGPEHPDTATVLHNLATLYADTKAYTKAELLLQRAFTITEKSLGPEHPKAALSLRKISRLHWIVGKPVSAITLANLAQAIEEKNRIDFLLSGSEARKQAYMQQVLGNTFSDVSMSLSIQGHQAVVLGLLAVLQTKGRVLDEMSASAGRLRKNFTPEDRILFDQLATVAQQLSNLFYRDSPNVTLDVYRTRVRELTGKQETLQNELSKRSAEFRQQTASFSLSAVQAAIPTGAALIEWVRYLPLNSKTKDEKSDWSKPRYAAYMLRHEGEPSVQDIADAESIERLIQDFRTGLSNPQSTYVQEVARELSHKLIQPLQQHISPVEHLLISPDGALNLVPFAALREETGSYLGSKKRITYLTSGRDLLRFDMTAVGQGEPTIVADPDYGKTAAIVTKTEISEQSMRSADLNGGELIFKSLPGTAEEAKTLKTLMKVSDDQVLTKTHATEERLKQLHGPRILHVATHGFFLKDNELPTAALKQVGSSQNRAPVPLGENPLLRSGLALAGANLRRSGEKDDGILTAAEVAQMDLRGTQLVVLSACETGVGDVQNGEGVYGLRRALVLAGAETQVTSLWKVADDATKDLMVDYYQRLLKGEGRSEALRHAQLTMMKSKDRSHPYYWAAFVPIGDWRPLAKGHN